MKKIIIKDIDQIVYYDVCDNGLPIYMVENKNVSDFYITFNVKYGSIDTEFKINDKKYKVSNGIAHFLEHVNFNIKENYTAHDLFRKIGSNINAFTTFDFTSYEVSSNNHFEDNLNYLLDYVQTSYLTEEVVNKEKGIITEEVRMGKNNPGKRIYFERNRAIYNKSKRRNLITGEIDDVKGITIDELQLVHDNFYTPKNMFIIITGNFDHNEASKIIKDNQSKKKYYNYNNIEMIREKESDKVVTPYKEIIDQQIEIPKVKIVYKINKNKFKDIDPEELQLYLYVIFHNNIGNTSSFKEELFKEDKVSYLSGGTAIEGDYLTLNISIETKYPEEVIDRTINKIKNMSISSDDLERNKRVRIANLIYSYDDIEYVNTDIMDQLIRYNKIYDNLFEIIEKLNINKCEEILNRLDFTNQTVIVMKNNA